MAEPPYPPPGEPSGGSRAEPPHTPSGEPSGGSRAEPRPELRGLSAVPHGGDAPPGVLDFSTGISPLPTPEPILRAALKADLARYPHPTAAPLREALARAHGRAPDEVVAGAGSVELIYALAQAYAGPERMALVVGPAFGEYAQAARVSGAGVITVRAAQAPFAVEDAQLADAVAAQPSIAFLCRPSNPCLNAIDAAWLEAVAQATPSILWVIDEAYLPMFDGITPIAPSENVVVLRSLTKLFALPGLRLGYLLAPRAVAQVVQSMLPPWNVSQPALAAGVQAVAQLEHAPRMRQEITRLRRRMIDLLRPRLGAPVADGGPFLLYDVGDADAFAAHLLAAGVRVRSCASFGLSRHVRLGVRPEAEQDVLAAVMLRA